ncbi:hypothetical protein [Pseudomonas aeruginosa]|uniref:hypothetical protein n=1 Tax=Pseudomonas aeruginosa TaxID=287 RepID=UPI001123A467|nr:hypothetical protein [Pseudomonas aeruginosa]ELP1282592.1 hypothetical protein [Pseudomonas aeruginosa]MCT4840539.1 hypothetical protein [Pseudomonas aeruginosa]MDI2371039.1 hypothetical protein [Pseudomonas aeruginosa]MDL4522845.1 hypothetical protein [Pseudomonas aeruginosa]MDL4540295.1 hypothetical protein [Pseudomonas aeruginosa]
MHENDITGQLQAHLHDRFKLLGADALRKQRIYLDTKFWALLRDQIIGVRESNPNLVKLLEILRHRVKSGESICTFSGHTLTEVMGHASPDTRNATAELMDELSQGYCIANQDRLLANEIAHWYFSWIQPGKERTPLPQLAWSKPFYLHLDYLPPTIPNITPKEQWDIAIKFIEFTWSMPMTKIMLQLQNNETPYPLSDWNKRAAENINSEVRKYDHENSTRSSLYLSELTGLLDAITPTLVDIYVQVASQTGALLPRTSKEMEGCGDVIIRAIRAVAIDRGIEYTLPGVHIRTALHTAIRWDTRRKIKPNDLIDMEHAQAALPNCNFFMTDKPHVQLIRSMKLDETYSCTTIGDPALAIAALNKD